MDSVKRNKDSPRGGRSGGGRGDWRSEEYGRSEGGGSSDDTFHSLSSDNNMDMESDERERATAATRRSRSRIRKTRPGLRSSIPPPTIVSVERVASTTSTPVKNSLLNRPTRSKRKLEALAVNGEPQRRKTQRKSALCATELMKKIEFTDDEDDKKSESAESNQQTSDAVQVNTNSDSICHPCSVQLRRYPVRADVETVLLDTSTYSDFLPVTKATKPTDDDFELTEESTSPKSTSSDQDSDSQSHSSDDASSGPDYNYEPSENSDLWDSKSASSFSSGPDLDYEPSDDDSEDYTFSSKVRLQMRKKLRKFIVRKVQPCESDSSSASGLSFSLGSPSSSSHSSPESKSDTPRRTRGRPRKNQSSYVIQQSTLESSLGESSLSFSLGETGHSSKDSDVEAITSGISSAPPEEEKRKNPYSSDASSSIFFLNSENQSADSGMEVCVEVGQRRKRSPRKRSPRKRSPRKRSPRKSALPTSGTSLACDDDALCSAFGVNPCQVICEKVSSQPSKFDFNRM